jgi:DeoR/GlpR family transcriptional regulator of sugar metabolism
MIKADERREEIAEYIMRMGQVRIDDLVESFGVSRARRGDGPAVGPL